MEIMQSVNRPRRPFANRQTALSGVALAALLTLAPTLALGQDGARLPSPEEMWRIMQAQQKRIEELEQRLGAAAAAPTPAAQAPRPHGEAPAEAARIEKLEARVAQAEERLEATGGLLEQSLAESGTGGQGWWNRTSLGGYGSMRFEANDGEGSNTGFTFRRFVLAVDAKPTDRLQTYLELEFERFTQLELEKGVSSEAGAFAVEQAIEGTNGSEISLEQAWARYVVSPALQLDLGALLVPVGRFNINHDDNQWVLPRRTLVDRGAPVLPAKAAWAELGAGFSGRVALGSALLDYRLYAVNGATIDFELETVLKAKLEDSGETELESKLEAEFGPSRGPFDGNDNDSLALTGRLALKPAPAHEVALSGYVGNYVPAFLSRNETLWSVGFDGLHAIGGFEIEYEAVRTHFDNIDQVAMALSQRALAKERAIEGPVENGAFAKHEIEFTLSG
ncbi:MAG: hypothetical protein D6782_07150, partial [Alphaproteobacteria bacterium]